MKLWSSIRRLSPEQFIRLAWLFLQHPMFIGPTWKATKETMRICNSLYGKIHHRNGKANAFRHALWNVLICEKVKQKSKNKQKSVIWAEKVTDLHEKVAKSEILDTAMDLHNNGIGRSLFLTKNDQNEENWIKIIQNMLENAQKVTKLDEIECHETTLVYISE